MRYLRDPGKHVIREQADSESVRVVKNIGIIDPAATARGTSDAFIVERAGPCAWARCRKSSNWHLTHCEGRSAGVRCPVTVVPR